MVSDRPIVAVTIGDPAGVGPEVVLGALTSNPDIYEVCRPLVFGDAVVLERAATALGIESRLRPIERPSDGRYESGAIDLLDARTQEAQQIRVGEVQAAAGRAAFSYINRAIELTLAGETDAIATAPINKEALQLGGVPFLDHTAMLGKLTGSPHPMTMFTVQNMKIFFATRHESLSAAVAEISADLIYEQLLNANSALEEYGFRRARIAVAALNPHNGEDGIFGREELDALTPAVDRARHQGIQASG